MEKAKWFFLLFEFNSTKNHVAFIARHVAQKKRMGTIAGQVPVKGWVGYVLTN